MADYGTAISLSRELSHTSDDSSSDHSPRSVPTLSAAPPSAPKHASHKKAISADNRHHHAAVEIQRKPRGRPPGSKNKPKQPIIITKDNDSAMKPAILEISAGSDIINSIIRFARKNHVGISIMSATGSVSNVTLRHPISHAPSLSLHGPFNLLALSGSFMGSFQPKQGTSSNSCSFSFGISLAGAQGQVFGGIVAGKVMAASQVVVVGATFVSPTFYKVPNEDEEDELGEESKAISGGGGGGPAGANECCMSVYGLNNPTPISCQISSDAIHWGPPPRPHY